MLSVSLEGVPKEPEPHQVFESFPGSITFLIKVDNIFVLIYTKHCSNLLSVLLPPIDPVSQSFIVEKSLPPIYVVNKGETSYEENWPLPKIMENLKDPNSPPLLFAINRNLVASVKIVKCKLSKTAMMYRCIQFSRNVLPFF